MAFRIPSVQVTDLVDYLNELLKTDPVFVRNLCEVRLPVNATLADHPSVQVGRSFEHKDAPRVAGLIGLLNGFCGTIAEGERKGWGPVAAEYHAGRIVRFYRCDGVT